MKSSRKKKAEPLSQRLKTDFQKNWLLYVMLLPVLIYLIIFCYAPMYGVIIAFKNFKPRLGILGSDWVGLKYFKEFVGSVFFGRTLKNTLMISGLNLLFGFTPLVGVKETSHEGLRAEGRFAVAPQAQRGVQKAVADAGGDVSRRGDADEGGKVRSHCGAAVIIETGCRGGEEA